MGIVEMWGQWGQQGFGVSRDLGSHSRPPLTLSVKMTPNFQI